MEEKTFLSPMIKTVLIFTIIILTGILVVAVGNPFKKFLAPFTPSEIEGTPIPSINAIEISADAKSIINSETKAIIFTIADTQKYLKNAGYFYNPDTFQTTNAKYEGDCFLSASLSNNKDRIVFSTGCLPEDLPQVWIGEISTFNEIVCKIPEDKFCIPFTFCSNPIKTYNACVNSKAATIQSSFRFLIGYSGRNFLWSADDKTITYEADLGLSGITETRTVNSSTGEILNKISNNETANWKIYKNEKYGFEIKYPNNFSIKENNTKDELITFVVDTFQIDPAIAKSSLLEILPPNAKVTDTSVHILINEGKENTIGCFDVAPVHAPTGIRPYYIKSINAEIKNINGTEFYKVYMGKNLQNAIENPELYSSITTWHNLDVYLNVHNDKCWQVIIEYFSPAAEENMKIYNQIISTFKFIN